VNDLCGFNMNHGFMESISRTMSLTFLKPEDYEIMKNSESLADIKTFLLNSD